MGEEPLYSACFDKLRVVLVVIGVGISQCIATQLTSQVFADHTFKSPLCLTWFGMNFIGILGIPALIAGCRGDRRSTTSSMDERDLISSEDQVNFVEKSQKSSFERFCAEQLNLLNKLLLLYGLYVVANVSYVVALDGLSPALASAIFCAAPALVCCLSWWILDSKFSAAEAGAVVVAVAGILVTTSPWNKSSGQERSYAAVAAMSPVAAALYKVMFARYFTNAGWIAVGGTLAKLSLLNFFIGTPLLVCVVASGLESFPTNVPWGYVISSSLVAMVFNFLVNYGVSITVPILISIGSLLATALNVAIALVRSEELPEVSQSIGMSLLGFSLVALLFVVLRR